MWTLIQQMRKRASQGGAARGRKQRRSKRGASSRRSYTLGIEPLEERRLLAIDLGNITADAFMRVLSDQEMQEVSTEGVGSSDFEFELDQSAIVIAALSDLRKEALLSLRVFATLDIFEIDEAGNDVFLASEFFLGNDGDEIRLSLPPGRYHASIIGGNVSSFDLALHADTAPGELVGISNPNVSVLSGRELGTLSTASSVVLSEYVGFRSDNPEFAALTDQIDTYFFDLVKQGQVEIELQHSRETNVPFDVTLFRNADGDGVFERGTAEALATASAILDDATLTRDLSPGRYGIAVTPRLGPATGARAANYQLQTTYTVADGAGNSLGTARDAGAVDVSGVTFNDYLSPNDRTDFYKFTTVGDGPFVFNAVLYAMAPGSNFELDFIRDLNGNGRVEFNEVESSANAGNVNDGLTVHYFVPGTYFVRVRRTAGEGVYELQFSNRNSDLAGNTLTTAHGPTELHGIQTFSDRVSSADRFDVYRVRLTRQAVFEAQLGRMPAGTDASLSLIRDSDGDGFIDPGETLASSNNTGNASERISGNLTAGTYFVRVARVAGSPSYELRLIGDTVGDVLAAARVLSASGGGESEYLGPEDDADVYRFTIGSRRLVGVSVGSASEPIAVRLGQDSNGNGILDQGEVVSSTTAGVGANLLRVNLAAGTYFVVLNPVFQDEGTNYNVSIFNERPDGAGNTPADALELGTLDSARIFADFVGDGSVDLMDDLDDFYRFTVANGPFDFHSLLSVVPSGVPQVIGMELIRDDNLDQQIDGSEVLASASARSGFTGTESGQIDTVLVLPGTYYLRIQRLVGKVPYNLTLAAVSQDTVGNTLGTAANLGDLAQPISTSEFVGRIDPDDFFRFAVPSTGELEAAVDSANGSVAIEVIRDADDDGVIDPGETLANTNFVFGANDRLHGVVLPAADDNYYVRVLRTSSDTTYTLDLAFSIQRPFILPFQIPATAEKQIKAVQFDRGGEGIAYHDTTVGNSGNQSGVFRVPENTDVDVSTTTDTESVGRRVTGTAPGEFLEYTVFFEGSGVYDFDVRLSSPDLGATFHLEIDGVPISASVAVPDTGGEDNMVTIAAASGVLVRGGPHILRLAFDTGTGVNNNFAGSFNFIAIRRGFAGTFELTPAASSVAAEERMQMSLAWTVPSLGWRVLEHVDLRLRDDSGRLIWIRFDEAANTIALFNSSTSTFSPVKALGSDVVIFSPLVNLYVKNTKVTAAGPTSPTMVLTLDLKFSAIARGHWTIEAAASDDRGNNDPFAFAGVLDVV